MYHGTTLFGWYFHMEIIGHFQRNIVKIVFIALFLRVISTFGTCTEKNMVPYFSILRGKQERKKLQAILPQCVNLRIFMPFRFYVNSTYLCETKTEFQFWWISAIKILREFNLLVWNKNVENCHFKKALNFNLGEFLPFL